MKPIAKYILTFTLTLVSMCGVLGMTNYYLKYELPNKDLFTYNPNKHILILGDSQLECDIDEDYFPEAFNRCKSSDSYLFCYAKLREMVKNNPQIDTLILSYSQTSMQLDVDRRMHTEGIEQRLNLYWPYLDREDLSWFTYDEKVDNFLSFAFPTGRPHKETRGGFNRRSADEGFHKPEYTKPNEVEKNVNEYGNTCALAYISKIEKYCKDKGVEILLLIPPVHSEYINSKYCREVHNDKFPNLKYIDSEQSINDSLFYDGCHLNENGAAVYSNMLSKFVYK